MLEIIRLTPQISCHSKIMIETVRKKFTKAEIMKRVMKEHKATFGSLLETKREKYRRMKLEKSGALIVDDEESTPGDTELSWMLRVSENRLRVIKIDSENQRNKSTESVENINSIVTDNDEKLSKTQTAIIRKTSGTKIEFSEKKASKQITTIDRKAINLLNDKSPPIAVREKIPRDSKIVAAEMKKSKEFDVENRDEITNVYVTGRQKNIGDKIKESPSNEKFSVEKASKSMLTIFPESSLSSERNIDESEIQRREEERNSSVVISSFDVIENIKKAQLFSECNGNFDGEKNSEILSISAKQREFIQLPSVTRILNATMSENAKKMLELWAAKMIQKLGQEGFDEYKKEKLSISPKQREYIQLPSVTRILNATMSENAKKMLELWAAKMIQKLGQEGFAEYKKGLLHNGKLFHSVIESSLRKQPFQVPDDIKSCYTSVKNVLDEVENVRAIESQVVHQNLGYRGVVDCVASYRGNLCLIDWKKSDKTKYLLSSTYDAPLQVASYIGALNADKNYPFQIKSGLLVIAYTIGEPPTVFTLDQTNLQYYWKQWLGRLKKYYSMQNT